MSGHTKEATLRSRVLLNAIGVGALALVILGGPVAISYQLWTAADVRADGPLAVGPELGIEYAVADGQATTWGMPLPESTSAGTLSRVELLGVDNLEVEGMSACHGWTTEPDGTLTHCAPINSDGWPPANVTTELIEGVPLGTTPRDSPGILIGLKRQDVTRDGSIVGVRIIYVSGGATYQADQPWQLHLTRPASE